MFALAKTLLKYVEKINKGCYKGPVPKRRQTQAVLKYQRNGTELK